LVGVTLPDARWTPVIERWLFLALMLVAGLAWGLKLESRIDSVLQAVQLVELRVTEMDRTINRGILPLTEERMRRMAQDMAAMELQIREVQATNGKLSIEIERMKLVWAKTDLDRAKRP
jgi:predicted phage tail protein